MQNADAFCMGPGGGTGLPLKKADAFFKGTRGGGVKNRAATKRLLITITAVTANALPPPWGRLG